MIRMAAAEAVEESDLNELLDVPLRVTIEARFQRPKSHYGTGRNEGKLKASAPELLHTQAPDADKIARTVLDAMTRVVYRDDSLVANLYVVKHWAGGWWRPGVAVEVIWWEEGQTDSSTDTPKEAS